MDWFHTHVVETGRVATLVALITFIVTYAITRRVTRSIKARGENPTGSAESGPVNDIYIGGVHIHHQVWGILMVLVAALLEFRFQPGAPWREVLAGLFGIGAALVLDEFALWLHLEDVYWSEEGRKSIDAVMIAAVVGLAMLIGTSPIGENEPHSTLLGGTVVALGILIHLLYSVICLLKGKIATGLIGLPVPLLGFFGSMRLAHPESYWARRFYSPVKVEKARGRYRKYADRRERMRDLVGGRE